ncbi:hypothetical protein NPIL_505161, partial [Nephila pilipes]
VLARYGVDGDECQFGRHSGHFRVIQDYRVHHHKIIVELQFDKATLNLSSDNDSKLRCSSTITQCAVLVIFLIKT